MKYSEMVAQVAKEVNLPKSIVDKTYYAYWRFIRENVGKVELKDVNTEEEFNKYRMNFNIPCLGKLCVTNQRFLNCKKKEFYIKRNESIHKSSLEGKDV